MYFLITVQLSLKSIKENRNKLEISHAFIKWYIKLSLFTNGIIVKVETQKYLHQNYYN